MRPLVFACLSKDRSEDAVRLMEQLSCSPVGSPRILAAARAAIEASYPEPPRVLDLFGGGGTIALEGAELGAVMHSLDSNELAVFIQKSLLVHSQVAPAAVLAGLVRASGKRVLDQLAAETASLFPLRKTTFGYFWTYSLCCDECGYRFFLSKRPWLSKKGGRLIRFAFRDGPRRQTVHISESADKAEPQIAWTGRNGTVRCPRCGRLDSAVSVDRADLELIATVGLRPKRGKAFSHEVARTVPSRKTIERAETRVLAELGCPLPASVLPRWSGIVNPALYAIKTHADFLTRRQRVVLLLLIKELRDEFHRLCRAEGKAFATAVVCQLSGLIDQLIDWNCRLSMWISQNEQVGRAFCGPGVAMLWDFVETDPVQEGPANLWKKLARIAAGVQAIDRFPRTPTVARACAQAVPYPAEFFDAIVTDPPYYDNVYYNVLADFFYTWKRLLLSTIEPELFAEAQTDGLHELVASTQRSGRAELAHEAYCAELSKVLREAERVLKKDGVFAMLYSHNSLGGWEALVRAYRPTGLRITSLQPLSIERKQRPRAVRSDAVNTCVVLVAHRDASAKQAAALASLCDQLRDVSTTLGKSLQRAGWQEDDIASAVYAQSVGMLANVSEVTEGMSDREALKVFETVVQEAFPGFKISARRSL
jgi:putative DNA methylase